MIKFNAQEMFSDLLFVDSGYCLSSFLLCFPLWICEFFHVSLKFLYTFLFIRCCIWFKVSCKTRCMEEAIGVLKVAVVRGKGLVVRDFTSSDPYVILKLGNQVFLKFLYLVSSHSFMILVEVVAFFLYFLFSSYIRLLAMMPKKLTSLGLNEQKMYKPLMF